MKNKLLSIFLIVLLVSCNSTNNTSTGPYYYNGKIYKTAPKIKSTVTILKREICDTIPEGRCVIRGIFLDSCLFPESLDSTNKFSIIVFSDSSKKTIGKSSHYNFNYEINSGNMKIKFDLAGHYVELEKIAIKSKEIVTLKVVLRCYAVI